MVLGIGIKEENRIIPLVLGKESGNLLLPRWVPFVAGWAVESRRWKAFLMMYLEARERGEFPFLVTLRFTNGFFFFFLRDRKKIRTISGLEKDAEYCKERCNLEKNPFFFVKEEETHSILIYIPILSLSLFFSQSTAQHNDPSKILTHIIFPNIIPSFQPSFHTSFFWSTGRISWVVWCV